MLNWCEFFSNSTDEINYNMLKNCLLTYLNETTEICVKNCKNRYDQERHFTVSYHPAIESDRTKISNSKEQILNEIKSIDDVYSNDYKMRIEQLISYGKGISTKNFKQLFMKIFTGKIKTHWLPIAAMYENSNIDTVNKDHSKTM